MFRINLQRDNHVRRYSILFRAGAGWEGRLEEDAELKRRVEYHDWHHVERMRAIFEREIAELISKGWVVQSTS